MLCHHSRVEQAIQTHMIYVLTFLLGSRATRLALERYSNSRIGRLVKFDPWLGTFYGRQLVFDGTDKSMWLIYHLHTDKHTIRLPHAKLISQGQTLRCDAGRPL